MTSRSLLWLSISPHFRQQTDKGLNFNKKPNMQINARILLHYIAFALTFFLELRIIRKSLRGEL